MLLMDEPFGALDAMTRDRLHDELEALWTSTGKTVIFVTHNVREAVRLGDRVVLLASRPGRVAEIYDVTIPRPRRIDSPEVATLAATITDQLRRRRSAMAVATDRLVPTLAHRAAPSAAGRRKLWPATWPKLLAIAIVIGAWQIEVWTGWRQQYLMPSPFTVLDQLFHEPGSLLIASWRDPAARRRRLLSSRCVIGTRRSARGRARCRCCAPRSVR